MGSRHRPGTAPGPADDRPSTLRAPAGDPTLITQVKVRTRAKSITGFSLSKPVPGFKTSYRFSGSRLTSLEVTVMAVVTFVIRWWIGREDSRFRAHLSQNSVCNPYIRACSATLRFQCSRMAGAVSSDYHRLIWCPYIPDNTESTSSGSQTEDGSMLMMVTHDNIVSRCLSLLLQTL